MKSKEEVILERIKEKGKEYYSLIKGLTESFLYEKDAEDQEGGYYEVEIEIKRSVMVEASGVNEARKKAKDQRNWCYGGGFKPKDITVTGTVVQKFAKGKKS